MQYATQLYTLRSLSPVDRCRPVVDAGFDGVELVGVDPPDGFADLGLDVAAAHVDVETLEADASTVLDRVRGVGTDTLVVPIVEEEAFAPARVGETAARLDALAARVADAGGRLLYHNHEFEFEAGTFERCVGATTTLGFELDVGWATAAGADPVSLVDRFGERMPVVHLKDVRVDDSAPRGGVPVDLGAGDVDLAGVLAAARKADVEWVVFEHDDPRDPDRTVRAAGDWLGLS
ncbi:sugar phosphate isomerase/epimerase [Salinigranum rubrum]|uniref:Sugar phosphate isomerase/epimerase n=1 Tax=Salinigranum rubrum TaxID=755307 RepID=A0A2I8VMC9_9EURY|nr:sugar phosphate isomerase/epimerase [Salinigranum rubrum]AUV83083.1 sugar phosphate isomerase/epimerase [Salinigranum rubrum]